MDKPDSNKSGQPGKSKPEQNSVDRRSFMKAAAASGAALVAGAQSLSAQVTGATAAGVAATEEVEITSEGKHGSDFMMDVLKQMDFEFMTINTHSDSAGLQESVINYTGNKNPELITCLHEEVTVAMAHGYYKIEGKPLATLIYGSVGLQHAAMAVYSAFCDRVPVYIMLGNQRHAPNSRSVQDAPAMVREQGDPRRAAALTQEALSFLPPDDAPPADDALPPGLSDRARRQLGGLAALTGLAAALLSVQVAGHPPPAWELEAVRNATDVADVVGVPARAVMQLGTFGGVVALAALTLWLVAKADRQRPPPPARVDPTGWRRRLAGPRLPALAVLAGGTLALALCNRTKALVERDRPVDVRVREAQDGFGYPSSHTATAFIVSSIASSTLPLASASR